MNKIHLVFGPQGAGKSTYSKKLSEKVNGIHLSIDDWMWKLYGEDLPRPMNFKWIMERVERCEKQIWSTAEKISKCGCDVILDLAFTKLEKRELFQSLASNNNISTQLHFVNAHISIRKKRVLNRNIEKGETFSFEVTAGMFDFMETEFENPKEMELVNAIIIDTNPDLSKMNN
ncbi:AAA family ATPase [Tenacibaculum ovolyticum]|uniref:AAA family ATPase n=1 Tax=Tenacibaculum ovolyticum TaxID=104270 RepID=UPI001F2457DA|nr:ATP-binding protein [Tenacibaculum ovolyticum]